MDRVRCVWCNLEFDTTAAKCPNCGAPSNPADEFLGGHPLWLVVLFLILFCGPVVLAHLIFGG